MLIPKQKRVRDAGHLKFIRVLPCVVCLSPMSEAAHVRMGSCSGMGQKPDDSLTVPLCSIHHREQHNIGERTFWEREGIDPAPLAKRLYAISGQYQLATLEITRCRTKKQS